MHARASILSLRRMLARTARRQEPSTCVRAHALDHRRLNKQRSVSVRTSAAAGQSLRGRGRGRSIERQRQRQSARARARAELLHVSRPGARQVKTPTATSGFFYTEYKLFGSVRAIQVVVVEHLLCSFMGG